MKPKTLRGQLVQKMKPPVKQAPKFEGVGTKARLNTAANKMFFRGNEK